MDLKLCRHSFLLLLLQLLFSGCAEDVRDLRDDLPGLRTEAQEDETDWNRPFDESFSTQLTSKLYVAGVSCEGNERITVENNGDPATFLCERDQWLVTVDTINDCPESDCDRTTKISPFIANLRRATGDFPDNVRIFHIRPVSPVAPSVIDVLDNHWVRFERTSAPVVERKSQL